MTRAKGKKLYPETSHVKNTLLVRGVKMVKPFCMVLSSQNFRDKVYQEYTTGPCQMNVKDDPGTRYSWFKTCTHGPDKFEDGTDIPEGLRPYYEAVISTSTEPVVEDGVIVNYKNITTYKVVPRIVDVAWHPNIEGGGGHYKAQREGARSLESFDIAPYCEMKGCKRQDVTQFRNGLFCSKMHAQQIKLTESDDIPYLDWDRGSNNPISAGAARKQLAAMEV